MKATKHTLPHIARCSVQCALAITAMLFSACSALIVHPKPSASATQRNGQVKFTSAGEKIVGEIVIRHDAENFLAEITKGPGVPLLTISAKFGTDPKSKDLTEKHMLIARATGPLSHGGWTWKPKDLAKKTYSTEKLKDSSRAWGALPEVFMWGDAQAKGESFRVCLPDIVMHARAGHGAVQRFDYARHRNPTGEALPMQDLRKQPALETVICHLDK
jgi:hypothetical protein